MPEQLTELRETVYLLDHWLLQRSIIQDEPVGRNAWVRDVGRGAELPFVFSWAILPTCLNVHHSTSPEALCTKSFRVFIETSLHRPG